MLACAAAAAGGLAAVAVAAGDSPVSFSAATSYTAGGKYSYSVAAGDLNGDRRADVVVANSGRPAASTAVLFSRPGGRLTPPRDLHVAGDRGVAVADFDGDGKLDVVRMSDPDGNPRSRRSAVLFGDGHGRFPRRTRFEAPGNAFFDRLGLENPTVGDFNRDGKLDLAVTEAGNSRPGVWALLGDGTGHFSAGRRYPTAGALAEQAAVADFDGDGNPDIAVAVARDEISVPDGPGGLEVIFGDGSGDFPRARIFRVGDRLVSIAAGKIDGDRDPDLVVVNGSPTDTGARTDVRVLLGDGQGGFSRPKRYRVGDPLRSVVLADFDQDGKRDVAVTNEITRTRPANVWVLRGDGRGALLPARRFSLGRASCCSGQEIAAGHLNRDRKPDLIVARGTEQQLSVLLNATRTRRSRRR
jgi:hypothetical protein